MRKRIHKIASTIFDLNRQQAKSRGYGTTKPSTYEIWKQWKYYIPSQYVKEKYGPQNPEGQDEILFVMYPQLEMLSRRDSWYISNPDGSPMSSEDFAHLMLIGYMPYKREDENQKVISEANVRNTIMKYNPKPDDPTVLNNLTEINGIRQYVCPQCGASFWTKEGGGPGPKTVKIRNHPMTHAVEQRSCGGQRTEVDPGDYPLTINGIEYATIHQDPYAIKEGDEWYRYCGYPINIKTLASFIMDGMKTIRTEEYRYRMLSPTKGRTGIQKFMTVTCPRCWSENIDTDGSLEASRTLFLRRHKSGDLTGDDEEMFTCKHCGNQVGWDENLIIDSISTNPYIQVDVSGGKEGEKELSPRDSIYRPQTEFGHDPSLRLDELREELIELLYVHYAQDPDDKEGTKEKEVKLFVDYRFGKGIVGDPDEGENAEEIANKKNTLATLAEEHFGLEGHYTECQDCGHKMYEPNEVNTFKRARSGKINEINSKYGLGLSESDSTIGSRIQCEQIFDVNGNRQLAHSIDLSKYELDIGEPSREQEESYLDEPEDWAEGLFGKDKRVKKIATNDELTNEQLELLKAQDMEAYKKYLGLRTFYHGEGCTCGAHQGKRIRINIHQDPSRRLDNVEKFLKTQYEKKVQPFYDLLDEIQEVVSLVSHRYIDKGGKDAYDENEFVLDI